MLKHNKAKNQQTSPDRSRAGTITGSSLVDVTFHERAHTAAGTAKAARPTGRAVRPAGARASAEDEPLPSTLIGLGWASARSLKERDTETPVMRSRRPVRRSGRERWLLRLLILVPLALGLIFGGHFLLTASYFQVQHIQIEGTRNEQLISAIQRLQLGGVNIFLANTSADAAQVQALPPVSSATVTHSLPDTLVVHVVERQPVLIWQVGSSAFQVDTTGVLIEQVQQSNGLPVVSDEHQRDHNGHPFKPGGKIDPAMVQMARQLLERLPAEAGITSFSLHDTLDYGLVMVSADGWQARFGGPDDLDTKIKELTAILQLVKRQGQQLALVDVRFGFYPYYRLKGSVTTP